MAVILALDTSTKVCSIALHQNGEEIGHQAYHLQKSHSSLLPIIINQLLENVEMQKKDIEAVAISGGPGSYTGLRIGTSTAKGFCYGLQVPLLSFDSLDSMYEAVKNSVSKDTLVCPMIDARRMEVYCNLRDAEGDRIWKSKPLILDENVFDDFADRQILLIGNGAEKCRDLFASKPNIQINAKLYPNAFAVAELLESKFQKGEFEDLAYFEPDYLKEFQTKAPKGKLSI
ncbi:MAG: tRNA (adenosine(37)-N6)-threonylcarbamoyltransferase complex dimerization subunit type 1 TsaB [Cyclobacteriaceae bacterium]